MVDSSLLDFQRAVVDGISGLQHVSDIVHEDVARITIGHDQMNGQRAFGRAQAPDMQIVDVGYTGLPA